MLQVVLRHYRRFGLFSFGMACMCLSMVARSGAGLGEVGHLMIFGGCLLLFLALALLLYKVNPGQRGILEIAGASGILSTIAQIYVPIHPGAAALFAITIFFFLITVIWFYLHSPAASEFGASLTWRDRHSCDVPFPAKLVWKHIVPGIAPPEAHCTGFIERYEHDPDEEDTLRVIFKERRSGQAEYQITFLEKEAPLFCRFYFQGNESDGTIVDGVFSLSIEVLDRKSCTIIANEERCGLPLGHLIERWFDDVLGYQHDRLLDVLNKTYPNGAGVTRPLNQPAE